MDTVRAMFMRQSLKDCEDAFAEMVRRPDTLSWDWVVITAASEAQADAYRRQVHIRLTQGLLPRQTKYRVIADPEGKRVGSGGATLHVLSEVARAEGDVDALSKKRVLVLHSGGDSQRIPQYSACGKLFAHVPRALPDGRPSTLFDEFLISLSCVPARMQGGMLVMSGDVLLLFSALQIDLERLDAACLSIKTPVATGTHHGVFVTDGAGGVSAFLHKQDEAALRAAGAVNAQGMVDIDTGAIWLDGERVRRLHGLIEPPGAFDRFVNETVRLSFYGDFVYPMASGSTLDAYLAQAAEGERGEALRACRRAIWPVLSGTRLSMLRLSPASFIHFGTTGQWRDLMREGPETYALLGWRQSVMSLGTPQGVSAVGSVIAPGAAVGVGSAVEMSCIGPGVVIGEGCVVSGAAMERGTVPMGAALSVLPVETDGGPAFCARLYGVADNPKEAVRMGEKLDQPLWTAPLHPVAKTQQAAIDAALSGGGADSYLSLRDSFAAARMDAVLEQQQALLDDVRAGRIEEALTSGADAHKLLPLLSTDESRPRQIALLKRRAARAPFPLKHRLYYTLARAEAPRDLRRADAFDDACWQAVNDHLLGHALDSLAALDTPRIVREEARVTLPVRTNFGGGWSDTPPYCLEHGGTVLNASLLLEGKRPVSAVARRLNEPVIRIESRDQGVAQEYVDLARLQTGNPHDAHALAKAALVVLGVTPPGAPEGPLAGRMQRLGGGIEIITDVTGVPKGSGLGTSSILCAATARALAQLLGQPDDDGRISDLALCMEQLMNTGGGWQDQIGGLLTGMKLTSSQPGTPQRLSWRRIEMPDAAFATLSDRLALVYTGQRRMARSILREIMGKAVRGDAETLDILAQIQRLAVLMAFELETGDIDQFARLLREHWALSKRLDAGSTNTCIDYMLAAADDLIDGMMICGAGGGGFMNILLKDGVPKAVLARRYEEVFQESGVKVWDATLER